MNDHVYVSARTLSSGARRKQEEYRILDWEAIVFVYIYIHSLSLSLSRTKKS